MPCQNETVVQNSTLGGDEAQALYEEVNDIIYGFLLPTVCAFGMVGNVLNLTILTRRKLQKSFRTLEQAANLCLISLAVSDLMFCFFAFPSTFLPKDDQYATKGVMLIYRIYGTAVINVFIMISTWLTVAMSLERYLAICHPLRQDLYLTTRRIKIVIAITYIFSFIFNIPVLWRYEVQHVCPTPNQDSAVEFELLERTIDSVIYSGRGEMNGGEAVGAQNGLTTNSTAWGRSERRYRTGALTVGMYSSNITTQSDPFLASITISSATSYKKLTSVAFRAKQVFLWGSSQLDTLYRILWAVVNNVVPLLLLLYFNVCLCRKIYRSYKMRLKFKQDHHNRHENSSHVLTVTLVVIVVMFCLLVAPSEVVIHVALITNTNNTYTYQSVEAVMNFMQSLNFSVNFVLYCIISPYFRKTLRYLFCCGCYNIYQVSKQWKKEFETSLM